MKMKLNLELISILLILFTSMNIFAKLEIQTSTGYESYTDGKTNSTFSDMSNHIFIGASINAKETIIIGQNVSLINQSIKTASENKISTMELGPRLNYYFNQEKNYFFSVAWNPYAKGERVGTTTDTISGWSYLIALGAVLKMSPSVFLGASINYHTLTITESKNGTTETETSDAYSSLSPMLNLTFRFR